MSSAQRLKLTAIACSIGFFVACGGHSDTPPANAAATPPGATAGTAPSSATPTASPGPLGVVEDKSAGLTGTDADSNGIRDDIDALIKAKYADSSATQKAAEQDARSTQLMLVATTKDEAVSAVTAQARAVNCDFLVMPSHASAAKMSKEIEALTANTPERIKAYVKANALISGTILPSANGQTCEFQ